MLTRSPAKERSKNEQGPAPAGGAVGTDQASPTSGAGRAASLQGAGGGGNSAALAMMGAETAGALEALPYPHASAIRRTLGRDIPGSAVLDPAGCEERGVVAFTEGDVVHFASATPALEVAAHEAAHLLQHAGLTRDQGLGAEGHAEAIAKSAADGQSAAPFLGGQGAAVSGEAHAYTKVAGKPYDTVSDDGKMAVVDHGREAWAESGKIASSNKILDEHHSKARIEELSGGSVALAPPGAKAGAGTTTLKKFRMVDRASGAEADLHDDCGSANQQMLGSEHHGKTEFVAANQRGGTQEFTGAEGYHADDHAPGGVVSTTEVLSGQIYVRIMAREYKKTLTRVDALKEWAKLSAADKDRLSKQYGINQFAKPGVGQGITIGSERDMPGAVSGGYNFHFALNLMESGHDYTTLEDYDSSGVKYYFDMYGPETKGQAFSQDASNVGALGNKTTTMVVEHSETLTGSVTTNGTWLVDDPATSSNKRFLAKGDKVTIQRKGSSWLKVTVTSGKLAKQEGWMMSNYFTQ